MLQSYTSVLSLARMESHHILFVYADGGPDHRLSYVTVRLSLVALFVNLGLDVLIAGQTAPSHSWANPVERIMSVINLGLQCIGIMQAKMGDAFEKHVQGCKNLKQIRLACKDHIDDVAQSLAPMKELLSSILRRLQLKGKKFDLFNSATEMEIDSFWEVLLSIGATLTKENKSQVSINNMASLQQYFEHCCTFRKYSITIKKCGKDSCDICAPVRMPRDLFTGAFYFVLCVCTCTCTFNADFLLLLTYC